MSSRAESACILCLRFESERRAAWVESAAAYRRHLSSSPPLVHPSVTDLSRRAESACCLCPDGLCLRSECEPGWSQPLSIGDTCPAPRRWSISRSQTCPGGRNVRVFFVQAIFVSGLSVNGERPGSSQPLSFGDTCPTPGCRLVHQSFTDLSEAGGECV